MDFQDVVVFVLFGILVGIIMALRLRREPIIHVAPQATATATSYPSSGGGSSKGGILIPVLVGLVIFTVASQLLSRGAEVPQQAKVPQVESVPQEEVVTVPTAIPIPTTTLPTEVYVSPVPEPIMARQETDTFITKALGILVLAAMGVSIVVVSAVFLMRYRDGAEDTSPQVISPHPIPQPEINVYPPSEPVKIRPVWESYAEEILNRVEQ